MATNSQSINQLIDRLSKEWVGPDDQKIQTIDMANINHIALNKKSDVLRIEIACLERGTVPLRYLRNIGTIGIEGQQKLLCSTVVVCGAGGLGGTIIELLARQGVGHLVMVDKGRFAETDLNRQIITTEKDIGKTKVMIAAERVKAINSAVNVTSIDNAIEAENIVQFIKGADVVMDALDSVDTRRCVAEACSKLNIPYIHGAIAGFSGQVMTIFPNDRGLNMIYDNARSTMATGLETLMGTPAGTAALIAAWEVQEAVKILTGFGDPIRNRIVFLDFANNIVYEMPLDSED